MLFHRVVGAIALSLLGMWAMSAVTIQSANVTPNGVTRVTEMAVATDISKQTPGQWAPPTAAAQNQNLVSNSDVILSATVTAVQDVTPSGMGDRGNGGSPASGMFGKGIVMQEITLQPKQVLLGTVADGTIKVRMLIYNTGKDVTPPKVGDANLYFLQRTKDGYSTNLTQVQGMNAVDDITKLVDEAPLTAKLTAPATPLYFGQATPITVSLTNNTAAQMKITFINLSGFYYANRMESYVQSMVASAPKTEPGKPMQEPITLDANGKQTLTLYVTTLAPPSLALLGPDSYIVTFASLHADARFTQEAAVAGQPALNSVARSNWVDAMVGYAHSAPVADATTAPIKKIDAPILK